MTEFTNLRDLTNWVLSRPKGESKILIIRSVYKVVEQTVQPAKPHKTARTFLGIKAKLSLEEQASDEYFPTPDSRITLKEGLVFDLDNPVDLKDWNWVMYSSCLAANRSQTTSDRNALFFVEMPDYQAKRKVSKYKTKAKAFAHLEHLEVSTKREMAKLLGASILGMSESQVESYLYREADSDAGAKRIIELAESDDFFYRTIISDGITKGVIYRQNNAWYYSNYALGVIEDDILRYMKNPAKETIVKSLIINVKGGELQEMYGQQAEELAAKSQMSLEEKLDIDVHPNHPGVDPETMEVLDGPLVTKEDTPATTPKKRTATRTTRSSNSTSKAKK